MNFVKRALAAMALLVGALPSGLLANGEDQGAFPHILEGQAVALTRTVIDKLIARGDLPVRWREGVIASTRLESSLLGPEWKVIVLDPAAAADPDRALHVFFSAEGEYLGANFTGD